MHTAERYHDISCGHRVAGHESKCRHLHGHNYRIHFVCGADSLDHLGRVIDFSVIKQCLCMWVEDNWDHRFLAWEKDALMRRINDLTQTWDGALDSEDPGPAQLMLEESIVWTPFNPTAENMAQYLVDVIGPLQLVGTGVTLLQCKVEETRKCSATFTKDIEL
jgi:6-pyruvoyltetrahydropterin/6-carboxytetrahydropterin synthase